MRRSVPILGAMLMAGAAWAQVPPGTPGVEEQARRDAEGRAAFAKMPDTPGTGVEFDFARLAPHEVKA